MRKLAHGRTSFRICNVVTYDQQIARQTTIRYHIERVTDVPFLFTGQGSHAPGSPQPAQLPGTEVDNPTSHLRLQVDGNEMHWIARM